MHVENTGVLAKSPNEFLVCASLGALGKYSTAGFSPSRNLPLKVNEQSIQLCGSAIPLWPKAGAVQTKSVQKFLGSNSRGQRASAKLWAIPLTVDTRESMTSEYSSILVVAQNDRDPRFFQRVECFNWNPSHERRDQQLAEYYDMGLKEQKIFNLLLDYRESGRR
jgi:ribosomal protein S16